MADLHLVEPGHRNTPEFDAWDRAIVGLMVGLGLWTTTAIVVGTVVMWDWLHSSL